MTMHLSHLNGGHLGRHITITRTDTPGAQPAWQVSGVLRHVDHQQDFITEQTFTEAEPSEIPGCAWTTVDVSGWTARLSHDAPITVEARP